MKKIMFLLPALWMMYMVSTAQHVADTKTITKTSAVEATVSEAPQVTFNNQTPAQHGNAQVTNKTSKFGGRGETDSAGTKEESPKTTDDGTLKTVPQVSDRLRKE